MRGGSAESAAGGFAPFKATVDRVGGEMKNTELMYDSGREQPLGVTVVIRQGCQGRCRGILGSILGGWGGVFYATAEQLKKKQNYWGVVSHRPISATDFVKNGG